MTCPKCRHRKTRVIDNANNTSKTEGYRKRRCEGCGYIFYTLETVIEYTESVKNTWNIYNKVNLRRQRLAAERDK